MLRFWERKGSSKSKDDEDSVEREEVVKVNQEEEHLPEPAIKRRSMLSSLRSSTEHHPSWMAITKTLSSFVALNHLICILCGTYLIRLPSVMKELGLIPVLLVGVVYYFSCPYLLFNIINIKNTVSARDEVSLNIVTALNLFWSTHTSAEKFSRRILTASIVGYHLAFCIGAVDYICRLSVKLLGYENHMGAIELAKISSLIPFTIITNFRHLNSLSIASMIANLSCFVCIPLFLAQIWLEGLSTFKAIPWVGNLNVIPIFVFITVVHICPIALFLMIEERMLMNNFTNKTGVFVIAFSCVTSTDLVLSLLAASCYGVFIDWSTDFTDITGLLTKLAFMTMLIFKYPLHFYVSSNNLWQNHLQSRAPLNLQIGWPNLILRVFLNATVVIIVLLMPTIKLLFNISLLIFTCNLAFLLPICFELLYTTTLDVGINHKLKIVIKNVFVAIFGLVTFGVGLKGVLLMQSEILPENILPASYKMPS